MPPTLSRRPRELSMSSGDLPMSSRSLDDLLMPQHCPGDLMTLSHFSGELPNSLRYPPGHRATYHRAPLIVSVATSLSPRTRCSRCSGWRTSTRSGVARCGRRCQSPRLMSIVCRLDRGLRRRVRSGRDPFTATPPYAPSAAPAAPLDLAHHYPRALPPEATSSAAIPLPHLRRRAPLHPFSPPAALHTATSPR